MMSLHEQLTEIQDQVEDAENDIESTVDVRLLELRQKVKAQAGKIKGMKKEKKEQLRQHEKEERERRERQQQSVIDQQRLQIEQLSEQLSGPPEARAHHMHSQSAAFFPLDAVSPSDSGTKGGRRALKRNKSMASSHYFREDEEETDSTESMDDDDDEHYHANANSNAHSHVQPYRTQMSAPGMMSMGMESTMNGYAPGNEGQYQTLSYPPHAHAQKPAPLLSDKAIKVIGGVIVVVVGIWAVSRYFDHKSKKGMPSILRRAPRVKY